MKVYFSKYIILITLIILHLLQLVTCFPKSVLGGAARTILKMKGGLNQNKTFWDPLL
jgi:hypothetical protein